MTQRVEFLPGEAPVFDRDCVGFRALVDGAAVNCFISNEALTDNFRADYTNTLPTFKANRGRIEEVASRMIRQNRIANGELVIKSADF